MRFDWSDDEDFPGQFELWQANCVRSLRGKKGQAALRELETALIELPEKCLVSGDLQDANGQVCAIGALAKHRGLNLVDSDPDTTTEVGESLGMPRLVAWKVVEINDLDFEHLSPAQRYKAVLEWVQSHLRAHAAKMTANV